MAIQTEPTRIQIPFADSGTKNTIPATNATPTASQAASWTDGFPTQCSLPLASGGIPPARADFNGIFNTMTQSIRFGQEGGVWAWDATVDYAANRVVLGSDGLLYWSVAQSGPNVGGAQDPTADDGTYWSTMPMLTPGLGDKSNKAATTEWVKDLGVAPVYMDENGNDNNDGLSAEAAVQSFSKALEIGSSISKNGFRIVVAGGTYSSAYFNGNDYSVPLRVSLELKGNVTINGYISLLDTDLSIQGNYSITINASGHNGFQLSYARLICYSTVIINISSGSYGFLEDVHSSAYFNKKLTINSTAASNVNVFGIGVLQDSSLILDSGCDLTGTHFHDGVVVNLSSELIIKSGNLSVSSNTQISGTCLYINYISNFHINGSSTLHSNGNRCVSVDNGSGFYIDSGNHSFTGASGAHVFTLANASVSHIICTSITLTGNSGGSSSAIYTMFNSVCYLYGCQIHFGGKFTSSFSLFYATGASAIVRDGSAWPMDGTVTGSPKSYNITTNSVLFTSGLGTNFGSTINGSVAGTTASGGVLA